MAFCPKCGVKIEYPAQNCPLCNFEIKDNYWDNGKPEESYPEGSGFRIIDKKIKRTVITAFINAFLFTPIFIILTIDFLHNKSISWSVYPAASLLLSWLLIICAISVKRFHLLDLLFFLIISVYLLIIDIIPDSHLSWSNNTGLPITFLCCTLAFLLYISIKKGQKHASRISALILSFSIILSFGIDFIVSYNHYGKFFSGWSFIVSASIIPFAVALYLFYYKLNKRIDLKKYFHI